MEILELLKNFSDSVTSEMSKKDLIARFEAILAAFKANIKDCKCR